MGALLYLLGFEKGNWFESRFESRQLEGQKKGEKAKKGKSGKFEAGTRRLPGKQKF